ncbi:hypothetical protein SBY92_000281 [Candida maltosa Xu316]
MKKIFLLAVFAFSQPIQSSNDLGQTDLHPYSSLFIKSINNKQVIQCIKKVEETSFKIKNCTDVTDKSCVCYFMKLIEQDCEQLKADQVWYLDTLDHPECMSKQ